MAFFNSPPNSSHINGDGPTMSAASRLRRMLAEDKNIVVAPGVYDGLTARIALAAGHNCLYMTGAGTSASRLGLPDLGLLTLNDMFSNAAMIAGLDRNIPLIADADTGFGGPLQVGRTVSMYISAGVAGLHIEDQVLMKRCGHLTGKEVVSTEEYIARIKAAVMARDKELGDIVIVARTDALQPLGYDEAISRLRAAIAVGADVAFLEGIESVEQAKQANADLAPTPVLFNMVQRGLSPNLTPAQAQELGFKVIIFPGAALGPVAVSVTENMKSLKLTGRDASFDNLIALSPRAVFEICRFNECMAFDKAVADGVSTSKGK